MNFKLQEETPETTDTEQPTPEEEEGAIKGNEEKETPEEEAKEETAREEEE